MTTLPDERPRELEGRLWSSTSSASRAAVATIVARVEILLLLELAAPPGGSVVLRMCSEPPCSARMPRERGSRAARGPLGPDGPEGRSGGTLGRMLVVRHDRDQDHRRNSSFTSRWPDGACSEVPHVYVGVCMVSVEPNVSCIHLGRVPSALASSSAVSSSPVASAEKRDLHKVVLYEG